jgi:SAM-dependent methyltransferase
MVRERVANRLACHWVIGFLVSEGGPRKPPRWSGEWSSPDPDDLRVRLAERSGAFVGSPCGVSAVLYREVMSRQADACGYGGVFNEVAEQYDRHRPSYPDLLIDRACEAAGIGAGAAVLEIGCGTGQLTRSLLARGLRVTAVEPGRQLIVRARDQLDAVSDVQFVNARLEDAVLPRAHYSAVFSASAIHWIDPDVGWRKAADALVDGGSLALVSYFGLEDPCSGDDQQAMRAAMARIAPEVAADWPRYRDLDGTLAGVVARSDNVSEVWAWLGDYAIARDYAARLFDHAHVVALPALVKHTADELNALLGTMSFWARLAPRQRDALAAENRALHERLGRPIRSSTAACLVSARRRPRT